MAVDRAYQEVLQHNIEWGDDRAIALKFKFASSTAQSTTLYEGDDKCGSHWQGLPVDPTGRESKQAAKATFQFSIQANVVYGQGGLSRFAITPKVVMTGGLFCCSRPRTDRLCAACRRPTTRAQPARSTATTRVTPAGSRAPSSVIRGANGKRHGRRPCSGGPKIAENLTSRRFHCLSRGALGS